MNIVEIKDGKFVPQEADVDMDGDSVVEWVNHDKVDHQVQITSRGGTLVLATSEVLHTGDKFQHDFKGLLEGSYNHVCLLTPGMAGVIIAL